MEHSCSRIFAVLSSLFCSSVIFFLIFLFFFLGVYLCLFYYILSVSISSVIFFLSTLKSFQVAESLKNSYVSLEIYKNLYITLLISQFCTPFINFFFPLSLQFLKPCTSSVFLVVFFCYIGDSNSRIRTRVPGQLSYGSFLYFIGTSNLIFWQ